MRFHFVLLLLFPCLGCRTSMENSPVTERSEESLEWRWSKEKASLTYSTEQHLPDYEVERVQPKEYYTPINIRTKQDRAIVYSYQDASERTVFTRWKDILYGA